MVAFPDEANKHFPVCSVLAHTNVCFLLSSPQGMYLSFDSVHLVVPPRSKVTVLPSNVFLNFLCQDSSVTFTNYNKIAVVPFHEVCSSVKKDRYISSFDDFTTYHP